jgi:hypothetical protein
VVPKLLQVLLRITYEIPRCGDAEALDEAVYIGALDKLARRFPDEADVSTMLSF